MFSTPQPPGLIEKAGPGHNAVAQSIRYWREIRGFSLGNLSLRSGVDKATLSRWETGKSLPRVPELVRALDALKVPDNERERCLQAIGTPRGQRRLAEDAAITELPIGIGEILRALRLRVGCTQEEAAQAAGVSLSLVSRWERGDCVPDQERLIALARQFSATEGELTFLCHHADTPALPVLPKDRDALNAALSNLIAYEPTPDLDLVFLALAGRYHTLWKERKIDLAEATGIWGHYADFLCWRHGRYDEAARLAQAALAGLESSPQHPYPIAGGQRAAVTALIWRHMLQGRPLEALKLLERFESGMPPIHQPWVQSIRGENLCRAGLLEPGVAAFQAAIERAPTAKAETVWRQIYSESLSRLGRYEEALKVLAPPSLSETRPSVLEGHAMTFAWALAGTGERSEAERIYTNIRPKIGKHISPLMEMIVAPVEHLLEGGQAPTPSPSPAAGEGSLAA